MIKENISLKDKNQMEIDYLVMKIVNNDLNVISDFCTIDTSKQFDYILNPIYDDKYTSDVEISLYNFYSHIKESYTQFCCIDEFSYFATRTQDNCDIVYHNKQNKLTNSEGYYIYILDNDIFPHNELLFSLMSNHIKSSNKENTYFFILRLHINKNREIYKKQYYFLE